MTGSSPADAPKKTLRDLPVATLRRVRDMLGEAFPAPRADVETLHDEKQRNQLAYQLGQRSIVDMLDQAIVLAKADKREEE